MAAEQGQGKFEISENNELHVSGFDSPAQEVKADAPMDPSRMASWIKDAYMDQYSREFWRTYRTQNQEPERRAFYHGGPHRQVNRRDGNYR